MNDKDLKLQLILEKFHNGYELYNENPMFRQVVYMLLNDTDPISIIEFLVTAHDLQTKTLVDIMTKKSQEPLQVKLDLDVTDEDLIKFIDEHKDQHDMMKIFKDFIKFLAINVEKPYKKEDDK